MINVEAIIESVCTQWFTPGVPYLSNETVGI